MARRIPIAVSRRALALGIGAVSWAALCGLWTRDLQQDLAKVQAGRGVTRAAALSPGEARDYLRRDPLRADALRVLAGDTKARQYDLLALAASVSRRDPQTQLMLLNAHAAARDLAGVLRDCDVLLSTTPELRPALTKILASNLGDPAIAGGLEAYAGREWFPGFLLAAARLEAADPRHVFALAEATGQLANTEDGDGLGAALVEAMLARQMYADAFKAADKIAGPTATRPLGFDAAGDAARIGALAWALTRDTNVQAERRGVSGIAVFVEPVARGVAARRVTNIARGGYLAAHRLAWGGAPGAWAGWRVRCLDSDARGNLVDLSLPAVADGTRVQFALEVPPGCAFQEWQLSVRGPEAQQSARIELSGLTLTPSRGIRMGAQL